MADLWHLNLHETQDTGSINDAAPKWVGSSSNKAFRNQGYDWEGFHPKEWQEGAACSGMDPKMFEVDGRLDEERKVEIARAISVCSSCPVKQQCLDDASEMDLATTIRGGTYSLNEVHGYADPCTKCNTVSWVMFRKGGGRKPSRRCAECARRSSKAWRDRGKVAS